MKICEIITYVECARAKALQLGPTLRLRGLQPAGLPCPWDSPDNNTGVGCHFLLQGIFLSQGSGIKSCIGRQILYR